MLYPKLERKFGKIITYEQDPAAHLKTEFGFDVLEVAKGRFAPEAYHDFIGFSVAEPLLNRAFRDTYGLDLSELFPNFRAQYWLVSTGGQQDHSCGHAYRLGAEAGRDSEIRPRHDAGALRV